MKLPGDPTEAEWQQQIIQLAHTFGWRHMHCRRSIGKGRTWVTATNIAWPDLTLWHEGVQRTIAAELKTDKGKLEPEQRATLLSLYEADWEVYVWRPSQLGRVASVLDPRTPTEQLFKIMRSFDELQEIFR